MPGPRNNKKKKSKTNKKKATTRPTVGESSCDSSFTSTTSDATSISEYSHHSSSPAPILTPPPIDEQPYEPHILNFDASYEHELPKHSKQSKIVEFQPQTPYIFDPGNGPRVRDTRVFLTSFFAQPPSQDDPMCAEFAQEEVLQMLCTILPEETALILWYNKSRATGRICPACKRLYRLGDILPDHLTDEQDRIESRSSPRLDAEQEISGLCSPVCFILASFNYPGAIKSAWGHTAEEMGDEAWRLLNSPGEESSKSDSERGLGMLVRMTRLHDLGLGQLCLPDIDFEEMDAAKREWEQAV